jgi:hypothetical protein
VKIYFHASVHQKPTYGNYYIRIVNRIVQLGYRINAEHVIKHSSDYLYARDVADDINKDYLESIKRIQSCDVMICEISFPSSIVVGHFLTRALQLGKPVLGLYHESTTPALLRGWELERFRIAGYNTSSLEDVIDFELKELASLPDQRFTMLMPGDIAGYLDELSEQGINRSEYIRNLIRKDREKK